MKRVLSVLIFLAFLVPATAFAGNDGPYEVLPKDGVYIVSKDGGKTQVGGVYTTEGDADRAAKKANKKWKQIHGDKEPEDSGDDRK